MKWTEDKLWDYDNFNGSGYRDYQSHNMANEPYEDNYVDYAVYDDFGMISNGFDTEEEAIRYAKANGGTEVCEVTHWEDGDIEETIVWEIGKFESNSKRNKSRKISEDAMDTRVGMIGTGAFRENLKSALSKLSQSKRALENLYDIYFDDDYLITNAPDFIDAMEKLINAETEYGKILYNYLDW